MLRLSGKKRGCPGVGMPGSTKPGTAMPEVKKCCCTTISVDTSVPRMSVNTVLPRSSP